MKYLDFLPFRDTVAEREFHMALEELIHRTLPTNNKLADYVFRIIYYDLKVERLLFEISKHQRYLMMKHDCQFDRLKIHELRRDLMNMFMEERILR